MASVLCGFRYLPGCVSIVKNDFVFAGKPETVRRVTAQALEIAFSLVVIQGAALCAQIGDIDQPQSPSGRQDDIAKMKRAKVNAGFME